MLPDPIMPSMAQRAGGNGANTSGSGSMLTSDFDTFLHMLTVQMQNQNPLNPMESTDFAVQLATFSGVEQQVRTNQLLDALSARMGLSELAGWVGMEALSASPAWFDGSPITLVPPEVPMADRAQLVVRNAFGAEVARLDVDPRADTIDFAGTGADGMPLPDGLYTFEVDSFHMGERIATNHVLNYARIEEARFDGGEVLLIVAGGAIIDSSTVVGLREGTRSPPVAAE